MSQFLHAIAQCQLALFHNMINPLTWIHCDNDVDCVINLVLIVVENTPPNEKQLNRHILFKKYDIKLNACLSKW